MNLLITKNVKVKLNPWDSHAYVQLLNFKEESVNWKKLNFEGMSSNGFVGNDVEKATDHILSPFWPNIYIYVPFCR